jgi:6-phospho-beta-glucosidase
MAHISLAVLGGSSVATPALVRALLDWAGHAQDRPALRLVLLGRSARKLGQVRAVCERMVREAQQDITIEASTDLRTGLERVDYVLNQMRVGGLEARAHDETFPQALGLPGEETVGPGGFANALRTIPVVNAALRTVSEVAPNAVVLNLTNPAGIVQYAAARYAHSTIISLCDSPITLGNELAALVERPRAGIDIGYLGMNHLGWVVSMCDAGRDYMDLALERIDRLSHLGVDATYIRASRAIPLPYVRYYLHPERILEQQQDKMPRARQLQALEQELLSRYERMSESGGDGLSVSEAVAKRGAVWYSAIVVPVLDALINDHASTWIVGVANKNLIPWLPPDTAVEVPCTIDSRGAHPLPVPEYALPPELRALLYGLSLYEALASRAIAEQDRDLALRSLIAHPLIRSIDRAQAVLEAVWPTGGV